MHAELFSLVDATNEAKVFAWGIEIVTSDDQEAVIYRRDPDSGQATFGKHLSAEAARARWSCVTPLRVVWESQRAPTLSPN